MKKKLDKKIFPIDFKSKNALFYYIPYGLLALWIVFSVLSIFTIHYKILTRGFVIFSIVIRLGIAAAGAKLLYDIFIKQVKQKQTYYLLKSFTGYGIVITYVFYSLPRIVGEFESIVSPFYSAFNYGSVLFVTIFPVILFLFLRLDKTKLATLCFTAGDLDYEKKMKKDKSFKKSEMVKIRKKRSIFSNLWFEWIDDILQAIITVMIIQQLLFQMYMIPSESMVPTFLVKDRVVVNKMVYGPHIPLTGWKLPAFARPKIGDIVVFKNPAVDDPESDVHYKNVFTRVFHPFIFLLTLSFVDIDKKADGTPKEWFIVKRLIASEGEKICVLNDKVYKKNRHSKWQLMELIPKEKEFGNVDLYMQNNPKMQLPKMTPELRDIVNNAKDIVNTEDETRLPEELNTLKEEFLQLLTEIDVEEFNAHTSLHLDSNAPRYSGNLKELNTLLLNILYFSVYNIPRSIAMQKHKELNGHLRKYRYNILYKNISDFRDYLEYYRRDPNFFNKHIVSSLSISGSDSPYTKFMKKYNGVYKKYRLQLFIKLLKMYKSNDSLKELIMNDDHYFHTDIKPVIDILYALIIYTDGIENNLGPNLIWSTFEHSNFSDYPEGKNEYIGSNSYFMMGDNRYNSHDSRFNSGRSYRKYLDPADTTAFGKSVEVSWDPRIIHMKYILGKAAAIYFPVDRLRFLN